MGYIQSLVNQNTVVRVSAKTTPTVFGSKSIYVTIPNWPVYATIKQIIVSASAGSFTAGTVSMNVITDGAAYRSLVTNDPQDFGDTFNFTLTSAENNVVDGGDTFVEDDRRVGCLYLVINSTAPFNQGTVFTIIVNGQAQEVYNATDHDLDPYFLKDRSYRVLTSINGVTTDVTQNALRNGNPYLIGPINNSQTWAALGAANTDYIYVGSTQQLTRLLVSMRASDGLNALPQSLIADYWNGTIWTPFPTVYDNTSDGQSTASTFTYTGEIYLSMDATGSSSSGGSGGSAGGGPWTPSQIATDPYAIYLNQVATASAPNTNLPQAPVALGPTYVPQMSWNPNRYWIRFSVGSLTSPLKLVALQPLNKLPN